MLSVQNKTGRGKKPKKSKVLERKLLDVSDEPRTTAETLVNDLVQPGIEVFREDVKSLEFCTGMDRQVLVMREKQLDDL